MTFDFWQNSFYNFTIAGRGTYNCKIIKQQFEEAWKIRNQLIALALPNVPAICLESEQNQETVSQALK